MNRTTTRTLFVAVAVLFVAVGVLAGAAAADSHDGGDDEATIGFDGEVEHEGNGGEGGFSCAGMPTDHDCDKGGELSAGPADVEYDGYNRGSLEGGEYEFSDEFVVTGADGDGVVIVVPCEFQDEPPEDNPCPASAGEYQGDSGTDGNAGGQSGDNGNSNGNGNGAGGDDGDRGGNADAPSQSEGRSNGSSASLVSFRR